ncbi:hypothetical protein COUCH_38745 [Couchioplanes caeruleus]|uniref:hypothetical protein n=1 Tax=Couchioplanes caeruleus TaxID=56438 RepID=UPI0020C0859E|nr:hypothetical protein [Couchioplanes caeruleus]UQU64802.1 hypothetical protein COUCH_38745 [Couchioplanes caeruleus]
MGMDVRVLRVGALVAVLVVAGCSVADDGGRDHNPAHQPGYVLPERAVDGSAPTAPDDHVVRGGDGYGVRDSVFQLVDGADVVRVSLADLGGSLFQVATPAGSKVVPGVQADGNAVVAGLRDSGQAGPAMVTVQLARDVRWRVRLTGGASDESVDLTGGPYGGDVELVAGTTRAEVSLPGAAGTQRVVMTGGASKMVVHVAGAGPVRVAARSGAGSVTIDGQTHAGVAGGTVFAPLGWETARDRYDIDAAGGVSELTVNRN